MIQPRGDNSAKIEWQMSADVSDFVLFIAACIMACKPTNNCWIVLIYMSLERADSGQSDEAIIYSSNATNSFYFKAKVKKCVNSHIFLPTEFFNMGNLDFLGRYAL